MKKYRLWSIVALAIVFFGAVPAVRAEEEGAFVTNVQGRASVIRAGVEEPASVGMALRKEDGIKTDVDGRLDLSTNGVAGVRLLALTEGSIKELSPAKVGVSVSKGNVIVNVKELPRENQFDLETPTAIAAVRGTQFWGRVDAAGQAAVTTIAVREGVIQIAVKESGFAFSLSQGQAIDIPPGLGDPQVRPASDAEMQAMARASEIAIWTDEDRSTQ